jgi:alkylation response protein AidB-like acyl-CoA dehydrogenase
MDFDFNDEQEQLREACLRWVDKAYTFDRRQAIVRDEHGFSAQAYQELAELGLTALYVPEVHGGMGMGPVEGMVVMESLGRGMLLEPLAATLVCSAVLAQHADAAVQAAWLPRLASGEARVALAHQEPKARYDLTHCDTHAQPQGHGHAITGHKSLVPCGDSAQAFIVPAMLNQRIALFLVEAGATGCHTRGYTLQDGSRAAELTLQQTPATCITQDGAHVLAQAVDIGIALACAEAIGVMDKTLLTTADYLNTRKQFGVPIASFQALRHRLADMKMQLELARSMSYYATLKLEAPDAERRMALSRAKVQLGQSMRYVGQQAVQLHGGIGVTDEYIVSHYFKRLTQLEMTFGDTLHHLGHVSEAMQDTAGVFV